jgi:hypothetical protein
MRRVDLHIVRATRGWRLQNADGRNLAVFRNVEAALDNGEARARQLQIRGLNVRVTIHHPGRAPKAFDFAAQTESVESYALTRCCLS